MAFGQAKRLAYLLRKAFMIPVGAFVIFIGIALCLYFYPDLSRAETEIDFQRNTLVNAAEQILQQHAAEWPLPLREKMSEFKNSVASRSFHRAIQLAQEIREHPQARGDREIFLLKGDSEILAYAETYRSRFLRNLFVGLFVILVGACCAAEGLVRARRAGRYISGEQLMSQLKKIEMPEFPSKDFLRRLNVEAFRLFIVVNRFGQVVDMDLVEGPKAALPYITRAVRKWKFDPFIYKGKDPPVFGEVKLSVK